MIAVFSPAFARATGAEDDATVEPAPAPSSARTLPQGPHEWLEDPFIPVAPTELVTSPGARVTRGVFVSIQVNVDAQGQNIIGDAANEPSIAVDPTFPNRMAVGWRQFDTIASNFRQAGVGHTVDGGRTWTFPGVLEPGVFRSDPVLDADSTGNFYYNSLGIDPSYLCDVFSSSDGGANWGPPVYAHGGDKAWMTIDRSGGMGDGHIYSFWTAWYGCCDPDSFNRSVDGGASFEYPVYIPQQPYWGVTTVGPDGAAYVTGTSAGGIAFARSMNAQNWSQSITFDSSTVINLGGDVNGWTGPNPGGLLGQVWVAADHSGGPTAGYIYVLASVDPSGPDPLDVHFVRSTDGGLTWSSPMRVNDDLATTNAWQWFGTMSVGQSGRIDVIWNDTRNDPGGYDSELFYASSTDGGVTWSPNVAVSPPFDPHIGWPNQNKIGDYYDMVSDWVGANVAYAATFNGEQDVYYLRIGDYDCNSNRIGDGEDIAEGISLDSNGNGIPDECEELSIFVDGFESGDTSAWSSSVP
jgi:hypothetical protein